MYCRSAPIFIIRPPQSQFSRLRGVGFQGTSSRITPLTDGFGFLGRRVRMLWDKRYGRTPRIEVPKGKIADLRHKVKQLTGRTTTPLPLIALLQKLNPLSAQTLRSCVAISSAALFRLSYLLWRLVERFFQIHHQAEYSQGQKDSPHTDDHHDESVNSFRIIHGALSQNGRSGCA